MEGASGRSLACVTFEVAHEIRSGTLNCTYLPGEFPPVLWSMKSPTLFDAVLDGFFITTNEVLSFALQIVN